MIEYRLPLIERTYLFLIIFMLFNRSKEILLTFIEKKTFIFKSQQNKKTNFTRNWFSVKTLVLLHVFSCSPLFCKVLGTLNFHQYQFVIRNHLQKEPSKVITYNHFFLYKTLHIHWTKTHIVKLMIHSYRSTISQFLYFLNRSFIIK